MTNPGPSIHDDMRDLSKRLDRIDARLSGVEQTLAEFRGGKRVAMWIFGVIGFVVTNVMTFFAAKGKIF